MYDKKKVIAMMVSDAVKQGEEKQVIEENDSDANLPFSDKEDNDQDYVESDLAFELWRARELKRLLKERKAQQILT